MADLPAPSDYAGGPLIIGDDIAEITLIERLARKLVDLHGCDQPDLLVYRGQPFDIGGLKFIGTGPEGPPLPLWTYFTGWARELLEEQREPTKAMVEAGRRIHAALESETVARTGGRGTREPWAAMIDAARAEHPSGLPVDPKEVGRQHWANAAKAHVACLVQPTECAYPECGCRGIKL